MRTALNIVDPIGRFFAAFLFLGSSFMHVSTWAAQTALMASHGFPLPGLFLGAATALELVGGISLVIGWQTRIAAFALGTYAIVATSIFHSNFAVPSELDLFAKDLCLGGALLCLAVRTPLRFSLDRRIGGASADAAR